MEKGHGFYKFGMDSSDMPSVQKGEFGMRLEVPLSRASVPDSYRRRALDMADGFMGRHPDMAVDDIESISGSLEAYLDGSVGLDGKYAICLYIFMAEGWDTECHIEECSVLPDDGDFQGFKDCIMEELLGLAFGRAAL